MNPLQIILFAISMVFTILIIVSMPNKPDKVTHFDFSVICKDSPNRDYKHIDCGYNIQE